MAHDPVAPQSPEDESPQPARLQRSPIVEGRLLADDYFRLIHADQSGGLRVAPGLARVGLASALLGELVWDGDLVLADELVRCADQVSPRTALGHWVVERIRGEPKSRPIEVWLTYLAKEAYEQVAQRLLAANCIAQVERRRGLRKHTVYRPTDPNTWYVPRSIISDTLHRNRPIDPFYLHLAALAQYTHLLGDVLGHHVGAHQLDGLLPGLPAVITELLDATRKYVDDRTRSL